MKSLVSPSEHQLEIHIPLSTPPEIPLFEGYIRAIARTEVDHSQEIEDGDISEKRLASLRIGHGCIIAASGDEETAVNLWRQAGTSFSAIADDSDNGTISRLRAERLANLTETLVHRNDPDTTEYLKAGMAATTLEIVDALYSKLSPSANTPSVEQFSAFCQLGGEVAMATPLDDSRANTQPPQQARKRPQRRQ
jgi:hypothetical protein